MKTIKVHPAAVSWTAPALATHACRATTTGFVSNCRAARDPGSTVRGNL